ncbi:colicin E5-related ribonuclease [Desulfovibrio cuneatus]|uniref:colicin E5-related ribonuclease n=1 Tax=Desulfovibrio cuneatus TaxID=159728 RepID=UPI000408CE4D|nr:colicin E5-related ribonuclease [Desulfovibrio cuneatus]
MNDSESSNPDAETDGSLDGLNRDIGNAREITKDEEAYTDIYVSKQAIEAIIDSAKELIKLANTPTPEEVQKQREQVVQDYKDANGKDADVFAKLIYSGIDPALAKQMMTYPQVATIVREQTEINKAIDPNSLTAEDLTKPLQNSSLKGKTLGQAIVLSLAKLGDFINDIPLEEEREAIRNAIELATGGPIKFALGIAFNAGLDYVNTLTGDALGKGGAELVDNVVTKLWSGYYKEEHLQGIEDGLFVEGASVEKELAALAYLRADVATGISVVIGIGGGLIKLGNHLYDDRKIIKQVDKRGWTTEKIDEAIANPTRTVAWKDTRYKKDGTRNNDPATVYYAKDGSYVVRNDVTGEIVQVSNKYKKDWAVPWE